MPDECLYYCPYCARELVAVNCDKEDEDMLFVHDDVPHEDFEVDRVIN